MKYLSHICLVFALIFASLPSFAAHIIGGEITYECLGGGNYEFTIKVYRDCAGDGAPFDSPTNNIGINMHVTVYQGNSNTPMNIIDAGAPVITNVPPDVTNPCLIIPPGVCVEEGIYKFTTNLPPSNQSYHISYQRCCRNNTISNITDLGDTGATYTIEITPEAQDACNNSPVFNNFPPIIICAGTDINFDFSAVDPDGDVLVYELCSPFDGGGPNTSSDQASLPNGVAPNPDLPPPYTPIAFSAPFSATNPMGGNPQIAIDGASGLITGIPELTGQYVVGVCVTEYRNGEILSVVRRDFQFNVANCEPTVVADILEDEIADDGSFRIISCGEDEVFFENESFQEQYIDTYFWEFDINGAVETFDQWDATVPFPGEGIYTGRLILNPDTECGDTAFISVEVYPDLTADFEYAYDTCVYGAVTFTDMSSSDAGPNSIVEWSWNYGDGNSELEQNPEHFYQIPGTLPVSLTIRDVNDCVETIVQPIDFYPVPALLVISPSTFDGCAPADIFFDNLSVPIDSTYDIIWDFGDGNTSGAISPLHTYEEPGTYTVSLEITSPIGCFTDTIFPDWIRVRPSPIAGFSYLPEQPNNFEPTVTFTDESVNAISWHWDFGGLDNSNFQNPVFMFPDTGIQVVQQIVVHESGCTDTAQAIIDVEPQVRYFLPNAFTPNGDGLNDVFRGAGVMDGARDFHFSIWNRYGEQLFETNDPLESWNGRKQNSGKDAPMGVYVVRVRFVNPRGQLIELDGFATLVR